MFSITVGTGFHLFDAVSPNSYSSSSYRLHIPGMGNLICYEITYLTNMAAPPPSDGCAQTVEASN